MKINNDEKYIINKNTKSDIGILKIIIKFDYLIENIMYFII